MCAFRSGDPPGEDRGPKGTADVLPLKRGPHYWLRRGQRAAAQGEFEEAARSLDLAMEAAPNDLGVMSARAQLYLVERRPEAALALTERACRLYPDVPELIGNRALLLSHLGRVDEAREAFAEALALSPDDPRILHGRAHAALQRGAMREALADLFDLLASKPEHADAWRQKALVHANLLELREARQAFLHAGRRLWAEGGSKREALLLVAFGAALRLFIRAGIGDSGGHAGDPPDD